ncbi:MAG: hypothetical protein EPO64_10025 [Nitrospirae bacterium]|nr:MAG: hypothetical protein EPO64_10025 [Nitrospirota bacterium]
MSARRTLGASLLFLLLCHGAVPAPLAAVPDGRPLEDAVPQPVVPKLQREVYDELERYLAGRQAATLHSLSEASALPAEFKAPFVVQTLHAPWVGMTAFERHGLRLASLAQSGPHGLPELIAAMGEGPMGERMGRVVAPTDIAPAPTEKEADIQVAYIVAVLQQAARLREQALRKLSLADRQFLFDHAASLAEQFTPQVSGSDERAQRQAEKDRRFSQLVGERLDSASLVAAAQVLAHLSNDEWLSRAQESFQARRPPPTTIPGITGDILLTRSTQAGLIVIGGPGPNSYELDQQVALVIDLGGDDRYEGLIASPATVEQGLSVVIDLAGNDIYRAAPLGLATGRLGIGLLVDRAGDDSYELAPGSGGTGFAGVGILDDAAGHDQYRGARLTQGAAIGGLGLLIDRAGHDRYTSTDFSIGFGGPLGIGAVIDMSGDDVYQCGEGAPSSYNEEEHPDAKPGDPLFQYDCFGMGTGSGQRVFPKDRADSSLGGLAGGWGLVIDVTGNDRYRSANFSQGAGYFFGAGIMLDLSGQDDHEAARYGQAAGAHGGLGLFIDYNGNDRYGSTGPVYNGGAAWDRSVTLAIDAGAGHDVYDLLRSSGLGLADHHAWGLFIEEGGADRYLVPQGMGTALNNSLSGFFDLAGEDDYATVPQSGPGQRGNQRTLVDPTGALFQDR